MVGGLILLKARFEFTRSHALLVASLSFSAIDCLAPMPGRRTPLPGAIFAGPGWVEDPANGLVPSCETRAAAAGAGVGCSGAGTGSNDSSRGDSRGSSSEQKSSRIFSRRPSQSSSLAGAGAACCCRATTCSPAAATGGDSRCVGPVVTLTWAPWPEEINRST